MTPALIAAFALMTAAAPPQDGAGEPLPPGAPTDPYELSAWCYGALDEYLVIYDKVQPDLRAIDAEFGGDRVQEAQPYASDMAAARTELKMIGDAVTEAEQASPRPIAERGVYYMRQGEAIWSVVEARSERELARAWMMWALPDRCDANARELSARSLLLGKALSYNADQHTQAPAPSAPRVAPEAAAPETALSAARTAESPPQPVPDAAPPAAAAIAPQTAVTAAAVTAAPVTAEAAPPALANDPSPLPPATSPAAPSSLPPSAAAIGTAPPPPSSAAEAASEPAMPATEVISVAPQPAAAAAAPTPPPASPAPAPVTSAGPIAAPPGADQAQEPAL